MNLDAGTMLLLQCTGTITFFTSSLFPFVLLAIFTMIFLACLFVIWEENIDLQYFVSSVHFRLFVTSIERLNITLT